jgi:hypothetical protein
MKNKISRPAVIVMAILMLALPVSLIAREKRGATLIITLKDGHFVEGELIVVKPDSLLLYSGKDETIDLARIKVIRVVKPPRIETGMLCGVTVGAVATAIFGAHDSGGEFGPIGTVLRGILFLSIGAGLGAGAGALAGKDKVIGLEGMTDPQVRVALAYLRKKARIRKTS